MSWRTVYISNHCHLSFKNGYMTVKGDQTIQIHVSEIHTLIIDSNMTTISTYLLNELIAAKVKVIFCDEKHNPNMELVPYYGAYDTSRTIEKEIEWHKETCGLLWKTIVQFKIRNQARILKKYDLEKSDMLLSYADDVLPYDSTNREGHAAKVYFNALFGNSFSRSDEKNPINSYLNYGYSILLSLINREVVANGYITQIGIHHRGPTNPFNLSCDLMEIFRPMVDEFAKENIGVQFDRTTKIKLVDMVNQKIVYDGKSQYLSNAVSLYVNKVLSNLEAGCIDERWFNYEQTKD